MARMEPVMERKRAILIVVVAVALFLVDVVLSWHAMERGVTFEYYWSLIRPFEAFVNGEQLHLIQPFGRQQGIQTYLFPLLMVTGLTVTALVAMSLFFHAASVVVLFAALREAYDTRTALGGSLVLLSINWFLSIRPPELPILWFLNSLLFYLFVRWWKTPDARYLYGMAVVTGFGAYVKALMLFPAAGLAVATLLIKRRTVLDALSVKQVVAAGIAAAVAYSVPLLHALHMGMLERPSVIDVGGSAAAAPFKLPARVGNIIELTRIEPVLGIPGSSYLYIALLLSGLFMVLRRRREVSVVIAAAVVFLLAVVSPTEGAPPHHLSVLYPFLIAIIAQNLYHTQQRISLALLFGISLVFGVTAVSVLGMPPIDDRGGIEGYVTIKEAETIRQQNISAPLATNHVHVFIGSVFDPDISERYVIAPQTAKIDLLWDGQGYLPADRQIPNNDAYIGLPALEQLYREQGAVLALIDGEACPNPPADADTHSPRFCGYNTSTIVEALSLDRDTAESVHMGGVDYLVFR